MVSVKDDDILNYYNIDSSYLVSKSPDKLRNMELISMLLKNIEIIDNLLLQ